MFVTNTFFYFIFSWVGAIDLLRREIISIYYFLSIIEKKN